jgi:hypothetical protein
MEKYRIGADGAPLAPGEAPPAAGPEDRNGDGEGDGAISNGQHDADADEERAG